MRTTLAQTGSEALENLGGGQPAEGRSDASLLMVVVVAESLKNVEGSTRFEAVG
jgi:hypothetical protein